MSEQISDIHTNEKGICIRTIYVKNTTGEILPKKYFFIFKEVYFIIRILYLTEYNKKLLNFLTNDSQCEQTQCVNHISNEFGISHNHPLPIYSVREVATTIKTRHFLQLSYA